MKILEYPEPTGAANEPGMVKTNPLNNRSYIRKTVLAVPQWRKILRSADEMLEIIVPGYNIAQIKTKYNEARFYIDLPDDVSDESSELAYKIVAAAETAMTYRLTHPVSI